MMSSWIDRCVGIAHSEPNRRAGIIATAVAAAIACTAGVYALYRRFGPATYARFKTMFGTAKVYQVEAVDGSAVRLLSVGDIVQSGTYVDDDRCYDLAFEYLKRYDLMFACDRPVQRVLVLGCGGYDYPEHLIAHHPETVVDAVEIDPAITAIARRYFFLDRLIEEFETEQTGRLNLICANARAYLVSNEERYDAIVNDTFDAGEPAPELVTEEAARLVHDRLVPGGLYLTNVVSAIEGPQSSFLHEQVALLRSVFAHVCIVPCAHDEFEAEDNVIVIASDGALPGDGV